MTYLSQYLDNKRPKSSFCLAAFLQDSLLNHHEMITASVAIKEGKEWERTFTPQKFASMTHQQIDEQDAIDRGTTSKSDGNGKALEAWSLLLKAKIALDLMEHADSYDENFSPKSDEDTKLSASSKRHPALDRGSSGPCWRKVGKSLKKSLTGYAWQVIRIMLNNG